MLLTQVIEIIKKKKAIFFTVYFILHLRTTFVPQSNLFTSHGFLQTLHQGGGSLLEGSLLTSIKEVNRLPSHGSLLTVPASCSSSSKINSAWRSATFCFFHVHRVHLEETELMILHQVPLTQRSPLVAIKGIAPDYHSCSSMYSCSTEHQKATMIMLVGLHFDFGSSPFRWVVLEDITLIFNNPFEGAKR